MADCPDCGAKAKCIDSRDAPGAIRRRRYACTGKKAHRFTTVEVLSERAKGAGVGTGGPLASSHLIEAKRQARSETLAAVRRVLTMLEQDKARIYDVLDSEFPKSNHMEKP